MKVPLSRNSRLLVSPGPVGPVGPDGPCGPGTPCGIVKFSTAALAVPVSVTLALLPGAPVVVVLTATVAAVPAAPDAPVAPVSPLAPCGIVKFSTAALAVPVSVTLALLPGAPVVIVPTATVAAVPGSPGTP